MGYTHGKKWDEENTKQAIMEVVNTLKLNHFPSKSQIKDFYGDNALSNRISRSGGSRYYAELLNLEIANSESEFGYFFEEFAIDEILRNTGFTSFHTNIKYPYDLLTNGNIKVDVKASKKVKNRGANFPHHTFNLEKREPTCDIFMFYCLDNNIEVEKLLIIPSCLLSGKTQIGIGGLSKWDGYIDKWEYFKIYNDFYEKIKKTEILLPKQNRKE